MWLGKNTVPSTPVLFNDIYVKNKLLYLKL